MRCLRLLAIVIVLVLMVSMVASPKAAAEEQSSSVLTLKQAIDMALQHDEGVKKAEAEIDRTKYLRDDAAQKLNFIPSAGATYGPQVELSWNNLLSADLQWQMSKRSAEVARDSLVLKVCKSYWDVQAAEDKVNVAKMLADQALINLQNARVALQVGTASPSDVVNAEAAWEQAKANLEAAKKSLDDSYNTFNQLVGLPPGERPVLAEKPPYSPLEVKDVDAEVERIVSSGPAVWLAEQKVTLAKWAADLMYFTGQYTPYKARQIAVEQAKLDAVSTKEIMRTLTMGLYLKALGVEEAYRAAQEALKIAQENLRVVKAKYEVGLVTKADVVAAEVKAAQAAQSVADLARQHAYLKLAFEKPWAVSGSGSSQ